MTATDLVYYLAGQGGAPAPSGEPWKTVTEAQLRAWTGNFCGPAIPAIKPECPQDPVTQIHCATSSGRQAVGLMQGVCFYTHWLNYTEAQQDAMIAAHPGSHIPVNCTDTPGAWGYSGIYPPCPSDDPVLLNGMLKKIWRAGKIPVCIAVGYHDEATDEAFAKWVSLLDDPLLCRIIIPGLEMNDFLDRPNIAKMIQRVSRYLPHALQYIEFTPGHGAGDTPEADWYGSGWKADQVFHDESGVAYTHGYDWPGFINVPGATGLLMNDGNFEDDQKLLDETGAFLIRLKKDGYWGLKKTVDTILFETVAYPRFWQGMPQDECNSHNLFTLERAYYQDYEERGIRARLAGYCNYG